MKNVVAAFLLISCISMFHLTVAYEKFQANMEEHGYDGELDVDPKTGLLRLPGINYSRDDADIYAWGKYEHLYCKVFKSGTIAYDRWYHDYCHKEVDGKQIDLCCSGFVCTGNSLSPYGHYCEVASKVH